MSAHHAVMAAAIFVSGWLAGFGPALAREADENLNWVKICGTESGSEVEICQISQNLLTDGGQLLASVAVQENSGEARKSLLVRVPTGMLIQPGIRTRIDGGSESTARFSVCFPNACFSDMVIDGAFIDAMKAGNRLVVTTLDQQGKPVTFPMTLIGFTSAYDGPPIDDATLAEKNRQLEAQLEERARAARQRLIDRQNEIIEGNN